MIFERYVKVLTQTVILELPMLKTNNLGKRLVPATSLACPLVGGGVAAGFQGGLGDLWVCREVTGVSVGTAGEPRLGQRRIWAPRAQAAGGAGAQGHRGTMARGSTSGPQHGNPAQLSGLPETPGVERTVGCSADSVSTHTPHRATPRHGRLTAIAHCSSGRCFRNYVRAEMLYSGTFTHFNLPPGTTPMTEA